MSLCHVNDRFDNTGFWFCQAIEFGHDSINVRAVRNPRISVDRAVFNEANDSGEVWR